MKWITIEEAGLSGSGKTKIWNVVAKQGGNVIATISWYGPWRKYIFEPRANTVYEETCLKDITAFLERATKEHKAVKTPSTGTERTT